jgi:predicted transcriptional regulator
MPRQLGGVHPLAGKVFQLHEQGYSQRQIATLVELSQSTVQRLLSGPVPETATDPDGIFAEYEELAKSALRDNTLAAYRHVHQTALVCHQNGYDVPWHSLPYLMALSAAEQEASTARERNSLRAETMMVYQDMREWRDA